MELEGEPSVLCNVVRKIKHGFGGASPLMNWVSSSKLHASFATALGLAGLILALKDANFHSLRGEGSSERVWLVPGLRNLGNNCFLNVILQALASSSHFKEFIERVIESCECRWGEEYVERLPLTSALAALMRDLSIACDRRMSLTPRRVMLALSSYIPNFSLTTQQDAEEALLHLLSSLREEFLDCYVPSHNSLAEVSLSTDDKIISTKRRREELSEQLRWQHHFLGPFNGILCSTLTCQSCSSQISLDYEFFHNLPIPVVLNGSHARMLGSSLEDCLKRFILAEQVENYHCRNCWHICAVKYLSTINPTKPEIEMLRCCTEEELCRCRNIIHLQAMPWSNNFSRVYKQLTIARCPKVLCFHLQRASMNEFGEQVKVQADLPTHIDGKVRHLDVGSSPPGAVVCSKGWVVRPLKHICIQIGPITFPYFLNLLPFIKSGVRAQDQNEKLLGRKTAKQYEQPASDVQLDQRMISSILELGDKSTKPEAPCAEKAGACQAFQESCHLPGIVGCSMTKQEDMHRQCHKKASVNCGKVPLAAPLYHLVSVVEHFGRAGSGHYIVYRRVGPEVENENHGEEFRPATSQWFCISDSEVRHVSEDVVLAAEASLLFYERLEGF